MKKIIYLLLACSPVFVKAQGVGVGTNTPNASAQLDVTSTNKGVLFPRLTTLQRDAITSPATGLMIFNITTNTVEFNVGTPASPVWVSANASGLTQVGLTNASTPAGSAGQIVYNTSNTSGVAVGPVYWDATQGKWISMTPGTANQINLVAAEPNAANPKGVNVGDVAFNVSGNNPQGLVYWSGSQWQSVNSPVPTDLTAVPTPQGNSLGQMIYNTTATSTVPVGPAYWNGATWVSAGGNNIYNTDGTLSNSRVVTVGGNQLFFNATTGNVVFNSPIGVGTSAPSEKLHVDGGGLPVAIAVSSNSKSVRLGMATAVNHYGLPRAGDAAINLNNSGSGLGITGNSGVRMYIDSIGRVGVGTSAPDASASLEVNSTSRGFLPPVMTAAQRNAIATPATGLTLYNTTDSSLQVNTGTPAAPIWTTATLDSRLKFFYSPTISIDLSSLGTKTLDLYTAVYKQQFGNPKVVSAGAPSSIPTFNSNQLNYYVLDYDNTVINNISISSSGVMTYDVVGSSPSFSSYLTVVFTVK